MKGLGQPNAAYLGDRGDADPELRALLDAAGRGREQYLQALAALCTARLLQPIVPVAGADPDPEAEPDMQALTLRAADGAAALPVFTGLDAFAAWQPNARPIRCRLDEVARAAAEQGCTAILVDLAGPHPLPIEGELIAEFAAGRRLVELGDGEWGWLYAAADSAPTDEPG